MGGDALLRTASKLASTCGPRLAFQHRHPEATGREFFEEGKALATVCAGHGSPLFINERLDMALHLRAHLHLPEAALAPREARPFAWEGMLISAAAHASTPAERLVGADFALLSPVFAPGSKPVVAHALLGREGFLEHATRLGVPCVALGGIDVGSVRSLEGKRALAGIAAVSAFWKSSEPESAALALIAWASLHVR